VRQPHPLLVQGAATNLEWARVHTKHNTISTKQTHPCPHPLWCRSEFKPFVAESAPASIATAHRVPSPPPCSPTPDCIFLVACLHGGAGVHPCTPGHGAALRRVCLTASRIVGSFKPPFFSWFVFSPLPPDWTPPPSAPPSAGTSGPTHPTRLCDTGTFVVGIARA
jgi:hypothetical protein